MLAAGVVLGLSGCDPSTTYNGQLAPGFSRLTVDNRTSWRCEVTVQRADAGCGLAPALLRAAINPGEEFRWDLCEGSYRLRATKLDTPVESFTKCYDARPGKHLVWPLVELGDKKARAD
ncbi:MAG: hypothetical protein ACYS5V_08715 [Planctomycetota bacterium]|jgi:hypothetical protein